MKIGIDIRCLSEGRMTGVEEYTFNLLDNLFTSDTKNKYVLFFNSFKKFPAIISRFEKYPHVALKKLRLPNKLLNFLFWYFNWPKIDRLAGGADVFFLPNIIFAGTSKKTKLLATIHDLSFERYPEFFSWKRRLWHAFVNPRKICQKADKIIAVSESTKNDLISLYKTKAEKISVIPSGISRDFRLIDRNDANLLKIKEKYNLPFKFILFLGTIEPRKNIIGLIRAYNRLRETGGIELGKFKLVIAGACGWKDSQIFSEINSSPYRKDILVPGFIADNDKPYIYNLASLFVYPSFFEGFGFPPLEAMACGTPVITANNSSLPEIAGNAGILIDPDKPEEIFQAMKEILENKELAEKMRKRGLTRAAQFNWAKAAQEFMGIIKNCEN